MRRMHSYDFAVSATPPFRVTMFILAFIRVLLIFWPGMKRIWRFAKRAEELDMVSQNEFDASTNLRKSFQRESRFVIALTLLREL